MNLVRLVAAVSIFLIGILGFVLIAPGTLASETFSIHGTTFSTRLYTTNGGIYAQCSTSPGASCTLRVADREVAGDQDGRIELDTSTGVIVFWIGNTRAARYDTRTNNMHPEPTNR